ncbi:MAG: hypothetical protein UU09_C0005G0007 [Microgenomates group bacterium GW2011_GWA2_40_6]|nr:MAG: hypothetical protein UU09_C0005G0007 [Microgenomates group bacterium GW2011_GWA2_40_6]
MCIICYNSGMFKGIFDTFCEDGLRAAGVNHGRSDIHGIINRGRADFAKAVAAEFEKTDILAATGGHLIRGNKKTGKITIEPIPE